MSKMIRSRGSIMIWTLLLGISLATVFFFFAQRLGANVASQRKTMEYQNAKVFLESYVAYIEGLDSLSLGAIRDGDPIDLNGITGTVTNEAETITGILDVGDNISYTADVPSSPTDKIQIEWDACPADAESLAISSIFAGPASGGCLGASYEEGADSDASSFDLTAFGAPTSYKLTAINDAVLYDNKWYLDLEMSLGFRKKFTVHRTFTPSGP